MKLFAGQSIQQHVLRRAQSAASSRIVLALAFALLFAPLSLAIAQSQNPVNAPNFSPLPAASWNEQRAAHLLQRAGFGGTPEQIRALAALGPRAAVRLVVYGEGMSAAQKAATGAVGSVRSFAHRLRWHVPVSAESPCSHGCGKARGAGVRHLGQARRF